MPTIMQLPAAGSISAADEIPISQSGVAMAVTVGSLLASTQPAIIVGSPSLLGRNSLGSGSPEQVNIGLGISLSEGTLAADGLDHAGFLVAGSLSIGSDIVISEQGNPMLLPASLLRGLFSAGENVSIDGSGVISATSGGAVSGGSITGYLVNALPTLTALTNLDLVAVSHSGTNCSIPYSGFLDGVTIDNASAAGPAADIDTFWTGQGSAVMVRQTLGAIWTWMASKLATYQLPVQEITTTTTLSASAHNGRLLICSQAVTLIPQTTAMGSGFQCMVINASSGNVTLGSSFVTSSGGLLLAPWQSATLSCATYSGGTIAFAAMPAGVSTLPIPGMVVGLTSLSVTTTSVTVSWQAPASGGAVSSYLVQHRPSGTTTWTGSTSVVGSTTYQVSSLSPSTSYDFIVEAVNGTGPGQASTVLTVVTSGVTLAVPMQVTGVVATPSTSGSVQLSWVSQSGTNAATSFTIQYRVTGSSNWTSSVSTTNANSAAVSGLAPGTGYDFSIFGVNSAGNGPASATVTAVTPAASASVTAIAWNLVPSGSYTAGSGAIGVNAHITPGASAVQFGFSTSASIPPASWTAAILVNTTLWGAYVPTPATSGNWYVWAEGVDGSAQTVNASPFIVQ